MQTLNPHPSDSTGQLRYLEAYRIVVAAIASTCAERIKRRALRILRGQKAMLSGDDSGLKTIWQEYCAQVQGEQSYFWDTYVEHVEMAIFSATAGLPAHELRALWLQTDESDDWLDELDVIPVTVPYSVDDIVQYIMKQVDQVAMESQDPRVRKYIARAYGDDD